MSLRRCPTHGPYVADDSTDFGETWCPECGPVPAPRPGSTVEDALDRLEEALEWCSVSDHAVDGGYHGRVGLDALAELRGLPGERGGTTVVIDHGYYRALVAERDRYKERAEAAEAERDRMRHWAGRAEVAEGKLDSAEAEVRRLTEGLREIEQTAAGEADEALRAFAAALLSDQPDDQDDPTAGLPDDLARLLRDPRIVVPQDSAVWTLVGEARLPDGRNLWDALRDWQNAPSNTPSADQPDGGETK